MEQSIYLIVFALAAVVTFVATRVTMVVAHRYGVLDQPGTRTFHTVATPRLGGLGIVAGISLPMLALLFFSDFRHILLGNSEYVAGLFLAGIIIVGLGVYDDLFGANAWKKFSFQFFAAAVLVQFGFVFQKISLFGLTFELNGYAWIATMIWIVGIINAVNFIDGMDGLAAAISLTLAVVFGVISLLQNNILSFLLMVALAGSLTGFLPLNRRPARIFMGDTGSMFLGLLLATMTVAGSTKSPASIALAGPMLALALPVLDTMFVIRGRFFQPGLKFGERVFRMFNADRNHFHHRLYAHFGSQAKVIATMWLLTLFFGAASILTAINGTKMIGYGIAIGAFAMVLILRIVSARVEQDPDSPETASEIEERWTMRSMRSMLSSFQPMRFDSPSGRETARFRKTGVKQDTSEQNPEEILSTTP